MILQADSHDVSLVKSIIVLMKKLRTVCTVHCTGGLASVTLALFKNPDTTTVIGRIKGCIWLNALRNRVSWCEGENDSFFAIATTRRRLRRDYKDQLNTMLLLRRRQLSCAWKGSKLNTSRCNWYLTSWIANWKNLTVKNFCCIVIVFGW